MKKIEISLNKSLRLNNVIYYQIDNMNSERIDIVVDKMNNYILSKSGKAVGPIIQRLEVKKCNEEITYNVQVIRQVDKYLNNIEKPYGMKPVIRIKNCIYAHYCGPEDKVGFAYDKIKVFAFENDILLSDTAYTIFVSGNENDNMIVADIFMERAKDE